MGVRKIHSESELVSFREELDYVVSNKCPFLIWQNDSKLKERRIHPCYLEKFDPKLCLIYVNEANHNTFSYTEKYVYVFIEEAKIIFKAEIITDFNQKFLTLGIPAEIKTIKQEEISKIRDSFYASLKNFYFNNKFNTDNISENYYSNSNFNSHHDRELFAAELKYNKLDEEDRKFASLRETPRARPKQNKRILISLPEEPKFSDDCLLWDLSTGGLGFITSKPEKYVKGKQVYVRGIDGKMFDHSMIGDIMSVRALDENEENGEYKIGIKLSK